MDSTRSTVTKMGNFYWLLAGLVMGFGLLSAFSIGMPIFLFGIFMALYRVWRAGGRGFGLTLIGLGLVPAFYLSYRYFTDDGSASYTDNFWAGVSVYVAIALVGGVWAVVEAHRSKPHSQPQPPHE